MTNDQIPAPVVLARLRAASKTQALMALAQEAACHAVIHERTIFSALLERERLGSTGVGAGVAIPHARLAKLDTQCTVFARLDRPVDFAAADDCPVDLIFVLLSPEAAGADHLQGLSRISSLLRDGKLCRELRRSRDPAALYSMLTGHSKPAAA